LISKQRHPAVQMFAHYVERFTAHSWALIWSVIGKRREEFCVPSPTEYILRSTNTRQRGAPGWTLQFLADEGIEVAPVVGSELGRGLGGPRCVSCPIERDAVTL
jgi:hypothetical protein